LSTREGKGENRTSIRGEERGEKGKPLFLGSVTLVKRRKKGKTPDGGQSPPHDRMARRGEEGGGRE